MDDTSYALMRRFARSFLRRKRNLLVCDVGSLDLNGTYKPLCSKQRYVGVDIAHGPNVDVVVEPYDYPFSDGAFDVVISGSTLEHVIDIYRWIKELARILKVGGWICVVAPAQIMHHPHPVDCWRVYPEGMKFLMESIAGLRVEKVRKKGIKRRAICVTSGIAQKC